MQYDNDQPAEKTLFDAANDLRGSVESATYKHLVLGLVFLKYVSDGFQARRARLDALTSDPAGDWYADDEEDRAAILEDRDAYEVENVFWVPPDARWAALLALGSQPDLGVQLDRALDLIERENPGSRTCSRRSTPEPPYHLRRWASSSRRSPRSASGPIQTRRATCSAASTNTS